MTNTIISQTLRRFRISSRSSDNTLGIFAATCSRDAVLALAREAGHDSIEQMAGVSGETTDEFLAGLSVFDVDAPDADDRFIVDDGDGDTVNLRANVEQLEAQGYHFVSYADGSWNVISPADERGLRATKRYASLFDAVTLNGGGTLMTAYSSTNHSPEFYRLKADDLFRFAGQDVGKGEPTFVSRITLKRWRKPSAPQDHSCVVVDERVGQARR